MRVRIRVAGGLSRKRLVSEARAAGQTVLVEISCVPERGKRLVVIEDERKEI